MCSSDLSCKKLDAFTFDFKETEWGWFNLHAYRFDHEWSTFIVETPEENWLAAGIDRMEQEESIALCEKRSEERRVGKECRSRCGSPHPRCGSHPWSYRKTQSPSQTYQWADYVR